MTTIKAKVTCPECEHQFVIEIPKPEPERIEGENYCYKCHHTWWCSASPNRRPMCPHCRSTQTKLGREHFKKWSPDQLPEVE